MNNGQKFIMIEEIIKAENLNEKYFEEKCFITELLNREDYSNFSLAKARVLPGITTELHTLQNTDELYYILSGTGEPEIDGKVKGTMEAGDALLIKQGQSQRIKNIGNDDLIFLCICSPRFHPQNYK